MVGDQARKAGFQRLYSLGQYSCQATLVFGTGGMHFDTVEALVETLSEALHETNHQTIVLIKGSRSMRMERVIRALLPESHSAKEEEGHS